MYVPWKAEDVVRHGRIIWNRRKTWTAKLGLHMNPYYYSVEPKFAPVFTAYGMLISQFYHQNPKLPADLQYIYNNFTHDLIRILALKNIVKGNEFCNNLEANAMLRGGVGYEIGGDLFNKVIGRSNRAIVSASARLAESNLSSYERSKIEAKIRSSNKMICVYDFGRNRLYKP